MGTFSESAKIMAKIEKLYWKKIFLKFFVANLTHLCTFTNSSKREGVERSFFKLILSHVHTYQLVVLGFKCTSEDA